MIKMGGMLIPPHDIAFDIDGVFADTFRTFLKRAREDYGYDFQYEDITEYDFTTVLDISEKDSSALIRDLLESPIEFGIGPIGNAGEIITRVAEEHPVLFVTARTDKDITSEWIHALLPDVHNGSVRVEATGAYESKLPVLQENEIHYFVEDRLETCFFLEDNGITPIVFDQPWNRKDHAFRVVRDWDDIHSLLDM
jgi:uncharacterized HAD superfamily protein